MQDQTHIVNAVEAKVYWQLRKLHIVLIIYGLLFIHGLTGYPLSLFGEGASGHMIKQDKPVVAISTKQGPERAGRGCTGSG
ncbi:MAG: hypothetical protein AAGA97_08735, partial [Pseudomonadota bacterium]